MPIPFDLWLIHPDIDMCEAFRSRFAGLPRVTVIQAKYEELQPHDCFVTAANSFGIMNAGIDAAVINFHGEGLMRRIQNRIQDEYLGEQPIGTAFLEATEHSDYPYIIHAPTMRVPGSINGTDTVYASTWAALICIYQAKTRDQLPIQTVAFPAMGTGFGNVPFSEAARQMAAAYKHYLEPPHRMNWDMVADRHRRITYDQNKRMVR